MSILNQLVSDLADCFDRLHLRFALGGALATSYWGIVRTTQDVDCLVAVPAVEFQRLADELHSIGCQQRDDAGILTDVTVGRMREQVDQWKLVECFRNSVQIELFAPVVPLQEEMLRRAVLKPWGEREVPITTAEDLILIKLSFHRSKDFQDIRGILWVQQGQLDLDYLRHWSAKTHDQATQMELEQLLREIALRSHSP